MQFPESLSRDCPNCYGKCQFIMAEKGVCAVGEPREEKTKIQAAYQCCHCNCKVIAEFSLISENKGIFDEDIAIYPSVGEWKPTVNLACIKNNKVKEDFEEAINCYNSKLYNASMIMSRRAIQQEVIKGDDDNRNLYEQIESMDISEKLKRLLKKVKNFGNYGAHPDFSLFDEKGQVIDDKKDFAKLSLNFLEKYFSEQYEIDLLTEGAPKNEKELEESKKK